MFSDNMPTIQLFDYINLFPSRIVVSRIIYKILQKLMNIER